MKYCFPSESLCSRREIYERCKHGFYCDHGESHIMKDTIPALQWRRCVMASQTTSVSIVYTTVCSGADEIKHWPL